MKSNYLSFRLLILVLLTIMLVHSNSTFGAQDWSRFLKEADSLSTAMNLDSALAAAQFALDIAAEEFGGNDTASATVLSWIGGYYYQISDFAKADSVYSLSLSIFRNRFDPTHPSVLKNMHSIAINLMEWGKIDSASNLLHKIIEFHLKPVEVNDPELAELYYNLGTINDLKEENDSSVFYYEKALEIRIGVFGQFDSLVAQTHLKLGKAYMRPYHVEQAKYHFQKSLEIYIQCKGLASLETSNVLYQLAQLHHQERDLDSAESLYLQVIDLRGKIFGKNSAHIARPLSQISDVYGLMGRFKLQRDCVIRSIEIAEAHKLDEPGTYAVSLLLAGYFYTTIDEFDVGDSLLRESVLAYKATFGDSTSNLAWPYRHLATIRYRSGDVAGAVRLYQDALTLLERTYGPTGGDLKYILTDLGELFWYYGDPTKSEPYFQRALEIAEKVWGPESQHVLAPLASLAKVYASQGRYDKTIFTLHKVIEITKLYYDADNYVMSIPLLQMGDIYTQMGEFSKAESSLREARRMLGPDPQNVLSIVESDVRMGWLMTEIESWDTAKVYFDRALAKVDSLEGTASVLAAWTFSVMARYYKRIGDQEEAAYYAYRAVSEEFYNFKAGALATSEAELLEFSNKLHQSVNLLLSSLTDLQSAGVQVPEEMLEKILLAKGAVTDQIMARRRVLNASSEVHLSTLLEQHRFATKRLSFVFGKSDENNSDVNEIDSLHHHIDSLELEMGLVAADIDPSAGRAAVKIGQILRSIPPNTTVLDFSRYRYSSGISDSSYDRYAAIRLISDGVPTFHDLGPADSIDLMVTRYQSQMAEIAQSGHFPIQTQFDTYRTLARRMYDALLKPFLSDSGVDKTLFISPDGALNLVSFATLIDDDDRFLVEGMPIHYLSSCRDLVTTNRSHSNNKGLLAIGSPDFDYDIEGEHSKMTQNDKLRAGIDMSQYSTMSIRSNCINFKEINALPLTNTEREIHTVVRSFHQDFGEDTVVTLLGEMATERNIRAACEHKRNLHIATHGFYLNGSCASDKRPALSILSSPNDIVISENSLLLSGLLFAGCNHPELAAAGDSWNDGIFSAFEISQLNLAGTKEVILSACETGLGTFEDGDGVYGLRRSFQIAGVGTVVSALWSIPDQSTAEMMSALYSQSNQPIYVRMREMQLDQIVRLHEQGIVDHPFLWGGFVATGEWK